MIIEVVSGSPRHVSVTNRVAIHLAAHLKNNTEHEVGIIDLRDHLLPPVQSVFSTIESTPPEFKSLAHRMLHADAFILVTPEYNGSYSPAMQNLFDHFPKQHRKAFGIVTASPGPLGGIRAAMQAQQFIYALFGVGSPYMLLTPGVDKKFDSDGTLVDASFQKSIDTFVNEFLWLAESLVTEKEIA